MLKDLKLLERGSFIPSGQTVQSGVPISAYFVKLVCLTVIKKKQKQRNEAQLRLKKI
jgi:hypothetical protein